MGEIQLQESAQTGKTQQFLLQQLLSAFCTQVKNSLEFLLDKCTRYGGPVPAAAHVPGENYFPSTFSSSYNWGHKQNNSKRRFKLRALQKVYQWISKPGAFRNTEIKVRYFSFLTKAKKNRIAHVAG